MVLSVLLAVQGLAWGGLNEGLAAAQAGDYATALRELKPLAEQGNAEAQYLLGVMYGSGDGVPQDYKEAVKWYRKAAEQGNAEAQYSLGLMYATERGVPQDYKEAAKWFRKAAEQGNAEAQYLLGAMYVRGEGVLQDYVQAHMWCNIAGVNGSEQGTSGRDRLAAKMTPAQIAEAQKLAREWVAKHP